MGKKRRKEKEENWRGRLPISVHLTPGLALSNMMASTHMWLFKFKFMQIKQNKQFSSFIMLVLFPGLDSHVRQVVHAENIFITVEISVGQHHPTQ